MAKNVNDIIVAERYFKDKDARSGADTSGYGISVGFIFGRRSEWTVGVLDMQIRRSGMYLSFSTGGETKVQTSKGSWLI